MNGMQLVSVIGLGPMGLPIARRLGRGGYDVTAWNRSPRPDAVLADAHVRLVQTPDELEGAVALSALPDIDQLVPLITAPRGWCDRMRGRGTVVVLSTTSPRKVTELAQLLAAWGISVIDAPMSGGDAGARDGTLSVMVGASEDDYQLVRPILSTFARSVHRMGPLGFGAAAKLCNQLVVAGTLCVLAEALVLAEAASLDPAALVEVMRGGLADSAILRAKAVKMLNSDYSLGGSAANQLKDLRYASELAVDFGLRLPLLDGVAALFAEVADQRLGAFDHSVVVDTVRSKAVKPTPTSDD
jgi:2-hydroxy-3-oxopropionate reductase